MMPSAIAGDVLDFGTLPEFKGVFAGVVHVFGTSPALGSNGIHHTGDILIGQVADAGDLVDMSAETEADLANAFLLFIVIEFRKESLSEQALTEVRKGGDDDLVPEGRKMFVRFQAFFRFG